jgi:hypothetical protein
MQITNLISLTTIIILLAFGQVRAGTNLDKFVGDWKASATLEYDGQQIKGTSTSSVKKVGNDYLVVSNDIFPGIGSGGSTTWYYSSGTLASEVKVNGSTSLATGTWYTSGNTFFSSIRQEGVDFDFTQNTKSTFVGNNKMISISTTSYGARIVGEATRITPPRITSNLAEVTLKQGKLMSRYTVTTNFGAKSFLAKGLPAGLQLNATTGVISGKPSKKGTFTVTFTAAKKQGSKVIQSKTAKKVFKVN